MKTLLLFALLFLYPFETKAQESQRTIFSDKGPTLTVIGHTTFGNAYFRPGAKAVGFSILFEGPAGPGRDPKAWFVAGLKMETPMTFLSNGQSADLRSGAVTVSAGFKFKLGQ